MYTIYNQSCSCVYKHIESRRSVLQHFETLIFFPAGSFQDETSTVDQLFLFGKTETDKTCFKRKRICNISGISETSRKQGWKRLNNSSWSGLNNHKPKYSYASPSAHTTTTFPSSVELPPFG